MVSLPGATSVLVPSPETLAAPARTIARPMRLAGHMSTNRYTRAALVRAADRIMRAERRHPAIIAECRGLARLVHAGMLTETELRAVIERAARASGKDDPDEIALCVAWGLEHPSAGTIPEITGGR